MQVKMKPEDQLFIFGTTVSPCVACYAVQRCVADHAHSRTEIQRFITEDIYIDDFFTTVDTVEAATYVAEELRNTFVLGGFKLTKWSANNLNFLHQTEQRHPVPNAIDVFLAN